MYLRNILVQRHLKYRLNIVVFIFFIEKEKEMLKKIFVTAGLALLFSTGATADTKLTAETKEIPLQCNQLFTETEQLIKEAEKQPGTHTQFANIKSKLSQSKKQILALEREVQIKSCDKGLVALNNIKKQQIQP